MNEHASPATQPKIPLGPSVIPHRKNAAEWVLWAVLRPVVWLARRLGVHGGA